MKKQVHGSSQGQTVTFHPVLKADMMNVVCSEDHDTEDLHVSGSV